MALTLQIEAWRAEKDCYYVHVEHWFEIIRRGDRRVVSFIEPEDGLSVNEYMKKYVLEDAKRVQWDDMPRWATGKEE
jgi:hypothetical protein